MAQAVVGIAFIGVIDVIAEQGSVAVEFPIESLCVGVKQYFRRVAAKALMWIPRAMDAVTVALSWDNSR